MNCVATRANPSILQTAYGKPWPAFHVKRTGRKYRQIYAIAAHSLLAVVLCGLLGCGGTVRPIVPNDIIGGGAAVETTILVKEPRTVPIAGRTLTLTVGEYRPTHVDSHGVFYSAPEGLLEVREGKQRPLVGGIHIPTAAGRYYSSLSIWVALWEGDFSKLPFADAWSRAYGQTWAMTRNGKEMVLK